MPFDKRYLAFYLDGREHPFTADIDLEPLARRLLAGESVRDIAMDAAKTTAKRYELDGSEKHWAKRAANKREIEAAGGDARLAWSMYLQGMTEAYARELESDILDEADSIVGDEIDEEEEDDDLDDDEVAT